LSCACAAPLAKARATAAAAQICIQLWQLNTVTVPAGVDEAAVRRRLLNEFSIEIGAGLGPLKGKIWRVGLMGETSKIENIHTFLRAFGKILNESGYGVDVEAAVAAAT
jgi:alanine-glyoxylate transaminase/serine-glyoxylate transaminase/serine-pyruvate transaminase